MAKKTINLYDFDHTVYRGDASVDFYLYSIRRHPRLIRYLPYQLWHACLYFLGMHSRKSFKERFFVFLNGITEIQNEVQLFWVGHRAKIKAWYLDHDRADDVIISASPEFLLKPIANDLRVKKLIATRMNSKNGKILGENCRAEEKTSRLFKVYEKPIVQESYSDSLSDMPILELAEYAFVVKGDSRIPIAEYKPSKLKGIFLRKNFIAFIFVGGFNALVGVMLAYTASLFIPNGTLAFVVGYAISLVISYFLNSVITFGIKSFSISTFLKFCISYIPNFLIQVMSVSLLIDVLSVDKLIAYIISVIIGIPITFLVLSVFAFRKKETKG